MSEATGTGETEEFARLLRELKDRSGLSYGTLAKRLHMSTSTLHRYCNGTAVPVDYAPVERLARVCRATPQELVDLHRRWILADAARGRRAEQPAAKDPAEEAGSDGTGATGGTAEMGTEAETEPGTEAETEPGTEAETEDGDQVAVMAVGGSVPPPRPSWLRRRRTALIASVVVAAVLGAVVYTLRPTSAGDNTTVSPIAGATEDDEAGTPSAGPSPSRSADRPSPTASASPTTTAGSGDGAGTGGTGTGGSESAGKQDTDRPGNAAAPLTVGVRPYVYDSPCSQHFLVDSAPEHVGPPAPEQDAPRWAAANGAVSSDEQRVALTVQGTGEETVVVEALHVRVLTKGAPLAWNDYSMGVGCGGGVETRSFDVALDSGSPTVTVKNGQRDFPYKVSESDPEVFYVTAHTEANDVRWDLSLDWSSGTRRGTVHIDDDGTPFRTSADANRPGYDYPLGGGEWIERVE
ncbi:helix-turn-helix domain-containing protein [Streptomyces sp. YU58]|uniref:helix-turn-helix domain-containing protein n=1 Tax=Streptomyces sp. SX92 TaxID=3158972 RepID=UPI0027BA7F0E|nr:helix-turn-helix transcriptional regulator [Streptomyces coralus]WLW53478.1 helix-turn-helix transcriptional regulator [Streptomyces coralus]